MLSTAMKAPSVAPLTASQVFAETVEAGGSNWPSLAGVALVVVCSVDTVVSSRPMEKWLAQLRGLPPRDANRLSASRSATTADLVLTVGSADIPGRNRPLRP